MNIKNVAFWLICICLVKLTSCKSSQNITQNGTQKTKLVFGLLPTDDKYEQETHMNGLVKYLSKKTDMEVTYRHEMDYYVIVEDMSEGLIDIAFTGPLAYLMAHDVNHSEVLVTTAHKKTNKLNTYKSVFITRSDSKIKTYEDYIKNFDNLKTAFVDPFSASGSVIPSAKLYESGIKVGKGHPNAIFEGSHRNAIDSLVAGKVHVAAVSDSELNIMIAENKIKAKDVRIIWESKPIPPVPIFVRTGMDAKLKEKLTQALIDMPKEDPKTHQQFVQMWGENLIFVRANDQMYAPMKEISKFIHHKKK